MKQYAKCFPYEEGETFPFIRLDGSEGNYPCTGALYENWHPQAIEDDEFNMLILLDGEMVKVRSCHFDFVFHTIEISWSVEDILEVDPSLTEEHARLVLLRLKKTHDASIGINWVIIEETINQLKQLKEL